MDDKVCVCNACTIEGGHFGHTIKTLRNAMKDLKVQLTCCVFTPIMQFIGEKCAENVLCPLCPFISATF